MRLPISAAGPVIGPITPTLMVPVPLGPLAPLELELALVLLPPQAASASRAVTPAAAVKHLARECAGNARRWLAARRGRAGAGLGAGAELGADTEFEAGARWSTGVGAANCLGLILGPPFVEAAGSGGWPFRPVTLGRAGVTLGCGHTRMMRCRLAPSNSS